MPRPPKPRALRQRRNKAATRAKLRPGGMRAPALPLRGCACGGPKPQPKRPKKRGPGRPRKPALPCDTCGDTGILPWHHLTQAWWARLWASPMGPEYIESDVDSLYMTASLVDAYWWGNGSDAKLASEIRQQLARFGATPLDRRRLEWELEKPEAEEATPPDSSPPKLVADPRATMRLVG